MKAFEKMQDRDEKKRRKEEAAALGPKPRGRPPKAKEVSPSEVDLEKSSTMAEKGSPPVKAPLKKRKVKKAAGEAECAEPSAGSGKKASEPVAKACAEGEAKVESRVPAERGQKAKKPGKVVLVPEADGGEVDLKKPTAAQAQAHAKRVAKVKLGICKLADNLSHQDARDMELPGPGFEGKCWTCAPSGDAMGAGCSIRVIPYQETFYVAARAHLPEYLTSVLKVAWHLVVCFEL